MFIVIDAYNLLKQLFRKQITDKERSWFLSFAGEYARKKNHILYIVFDGGSYSRPTAEKKGSVVVVYSGIKDSADDVIKTYIDEKLLKDMLLVTTDRQLNTYARRHDIVSIDSLDFYQLMKENKIQTYAGKAPHIVQKKDDSPLDELDILMQEGASMPYYKQEEKPEEYKEKKISKSEQRLLAILKKL